MSSTVTGIAPLTVYLLSITFTSAEASSLHCGHQLFSQRMCLLDHVRELAGHCKMRWDVCCLHAGDRSSGYGLR